MTAITLEDAQEVDAVIERFRQEMFDLRQDLAEAKNDADLFRFVLKFSANQEELSDALDDIVQPWFESWDKQEQLDTDPLVLREFLETVRAAAVERGLWEARPTHLSRNLDAMVSRFLSWPLPASVQSDICVLDRTYEHRYGTNLLTAEEAEAMLKHVLGWSV